MSTNIIRLSRKELYEQVWSEPMTKLAKKYGLSDVGLRKRCVKFKIPLPGAGYWAKKQYGKAEPPPPLPPFDGGEVVEFHIEIEREENRPVDEEQYREAEARIIFERDDKNRIRVPRALRNPHPYVAMTKKAFENTEPSIFSRDDDFLSAGSEEHLDVRISKNTLSRALRIMNALLKALEARGFTVSIVNKNEYSHYPSYMTCVSVLGQTIEFGLREFLKQTKRELPPAERDPWRRFEYSYSHSGRLTLEIKTWCAPRKNWSDGKIQRVEDCLNDFIVVLIKTAVELRTREIEREEEERRRREWERRREELEKLRREEEARLQDLLNKASGWQKSKQIREYIKAVRDDAIRKNGGIDPGSELDKWLAWAKQQADRLDPLVESPPSILD